ncbi:hypothetical protein [Qipengyuania nanhaisediminis]|uniref:Uncharacterized protein n=1 Tax=Qipengyuania nanhaisediminis TaxID=604088 RepID=A0A1I5MC34_9SPHN|nr:hypothetical protein [Qipengyuania nanhaisediminis]SFP07059.1 hypothetical protein SAMN04488060_1259 [Qipengyuania nanhaisediminis]
MTQGKDSSDENFGILLGWNSSPAGERIALKMQSTRKIVESEEDVREYRYFLSKEQAVQLGNYLYTLAGETAPIRKKRGLIERLFGG